MNATLHAVRPHTLSALSILFARYVAGQINEALWKRITNVIDASEASIDERVAFASFISDACAELGPDALNVPQLEEAQEMLTFTHVA